MMLKIYKHVSNKKVNKLNTEAYLFYKVRKQKHPANDEKTFVHFRELRVKNFPFVESGCWQILPAAPIAKERRPSVHGMEFSKTSVPQIYFAAGWMGRNHADHPTFCLRIKVSMQSSVYGQQKQTASAETC